MITVERRPMTLSEREAVEQSLATHGRGDGLDRGGLAFFCVAGGLVVGLLGMAAAQGIVERLLRHRLFPPTVSLALTLAGGVIGGLLGARFVARERRLERAHWKRMSAVWTDALAQGEMEVTHVWATEVVELIPDGDDEPGYFFAVEPENILFMVDALTWSDENGEELRFPCTAFDLVRLPGDDLIWEVIGRGERLAPSRTINPKLLKGVPFPPSGTIINTTLDQFIQDLH